MTKWSGDVTQLGQIGKRILGILAFIVFLLYLLSLILPVFQRCLNVSFC